MTGIVRGVTTADSGASAATGIFITLAPDPGVQAGDQLLVAIETREAPATFATTWRVPAGWTLVDMVPPTGTGSSGTGFLYRATYGTDVTGSSWTWDNGAGNTTGTRWTAELLTLDGSQVGAFQGAALQVQSASGTTQQTPALTTTGTTCLVAFAGSRLTGGVSYTWPAGWTEQADGGNGAQTNSPTLSSAARDVTVSAGSQQVTATASATVGNGWAGIVAFTAATPPVAANLTGSGTLTATSTPKNATSASLTASGTLTATGIPRLTVAGSLTASGALAAAAIKVVAVALSGSGTLTAAAGGPPVVNAPLTGSGTLTARRASITLNVDLSAVGTLITSVTVPPVNVDLTSTGTLSATALPTVNTDLGSVGILSAIYSVKVFAWVFRSPTQDVWFPIAGRGLIGAYQQGLTVYRVAGQWRTRLSPGPDELAAADRAYTGGALHRLSDAERADLIAGGFAPNITYEEVPA